MGVPGALDGLSHVVSDSVEEKGKKNSDIRGEIPSVISFLLTVLELFVVDDKKK